MHHSHPTEFSRVKIGIITPYKCQLSLLRSRFAHSLGASLIVDMEFNTVDGFQGREVDILILSTVRAADPNSTSGKNSSGIGFVADARRMNVALTRAKLSLWVLGNSRTLQVNPDWGALMKDAKERNLVLSVKMPYDSTFKTATPRNSYPEAMANGSRNLKTDNVNARRHAKRSGKETFEREGKDINISRGKRKVEREKSSNLDHSERGIVDNHQQISQTSKRLKGAPRHDTIDSNMEASAPMVEGSSNEEHNDSNALSRSDSGKELIVKRKKQREAVDAILFSSLIPSKKSEKSMKVISDKKPHSLPNVRGNMKPPKGRKG